MTCIRSLENFGIENRVYNIIIETTAILVNARVLCVRKSNTMTAAARRDRPIWQLLVARRTPAASRRRRGRRRYKKRYNVPNKIIYSVIYA